MGCPQHASRILALNPVWSCFALKLPNPTSPSYKSPSPNSISSSGIGGGRTAGTTPYGRITVDGLIRDDGYRYLAAYLPQEDFLYSVLTVQETIRYAALLRLPAYMPKRLKLQKVDEIIDYLGLARVIHNRVGGTFGRPGLSGGERRRVRIAMELVSDPRIVLLGEFDFAKSCELSASSGPQSIIQMSTYRSSQAPVTCRYVFSPLRI